MLRELHIENFAIIDKAHLKFEDAINLITGETGAGKSLLIDALRIIGGGRTNNSCIKAGAEQSQITAIFDAIPQAKRILENLAIKTEEYIYIRRIISQKSAAKNFINDTMVSANALKELFEVLVEMHGQFENQKLLTPKNQLNYLDSYAKTEKELKEYFEQYQKLENLKKNIENIKKINLSPAEIEWKNHQISELSKIKTTDEEYDEILSKIKIADKSNVLIEYLAKTTNILYDSKDSANSIINKCIAKIEEIDNGCRAKTIIELLNSINNLISSANAEIKDYIEVLNNYIGNFDALQSQVFEIQRLLRKYKVSKISELKNLKNSLIVELKNFQNAENMLAALNKELKIETEILLKLAKKLSDKRLKSSKKLEKEITKKIQQLEMPHSEFQISLIFDDQQITASGCDKITFIIKTNKGDIFKPLNEIASGGEISRVMLALKSINAKADEIQTIIFDEIDTGISGAAAAKVSDELFNLSKNCQVMCVTHQPAIAALPGAHFKIEKKVMNNQTLVNAKKLEYSERIQEIAILMTGGKITNTSAKSAEELLEHYKNK